MTPMLLQVRPGQENERGPQYMESALAAFHSLAGDEPLGLEMGYADGKVSLFVRTTENSASLIESQLYAQYPDTDIEFLTKDPFATKESEEVVSMDMTLDSPDIFPIKRHPQFDDLLSGANMDPIAGILSALARYPLPTMRGHVQIAIEPAPSKYRKRALRVLPLLGKGIAGLSPKYASFFASLALSRGWKRLAVFPLYMMLGGFRTWKVFSKIQAAVSEGKKGSDDSSDATSSRSHEKEDSVAAAKDKMNRLLFYCNMRLSVVVPKGHTAEGRKKLMEMASAFRQFTLPQTNEFATHDPVESASIPLGFKSAKFAFSSEELATLWHVPTILVQTQNLDRVISKKLEPPVNLPIPGVTDPAENLTILGEANFHGRRTKFGIRLDDRRRHVYVIGKTGMGKSTILENMVYSDIMAGKGVGVIDPHGDLIEAILRFTPKERSNDVVLFEPADKDFPISFNMLEAPNPDQRSLVASGLMSVFTKLWPESFSGRMEHILRNTLLALLENEGSSMLGILRMFGDDAYRAKIVSNVTDPVVKSFWEVEYAGWSDKYRTEAIAAIQNKVGQLLTTPLIRNIVGQVKSTLDIRHAMDTGKIVLVNLSKGKIGEDTAAFLGSMLVTRFQIDAMSRADIPEKERKDFFLYVDEFQNFATKSFATILSEARKYRLSLTMAHQYIGQLMIGGSDSSLKDAVFGNVGSIVSFQVGSDDAEPLSLQFEEMAMPKDILSLPKYHAYMRVLIDGIATKPFSVATLPPPKVEGGEDRVDVLRALSRERYSEKRSVVEEKILRWANSGVEAAMQKKTDEKAKEKEEEERKKARAKGMKLDEYRKWRDREMWVNTYNAIKKKQMLQEPVTDAELKELADLTPKLEATGGLPPPSKSMLDAVAKKEGKTLKKADAAE